ncbi:hypothetical protein GCM10011575_47040 [Microlunatus endophyticus]|uniref:Uncharacterized protein n=1 Tax=Microlunatus endophyticus TaxID=1716077 RepID=A0A917SIC0_9ACTN|nr:hypothetical protein GCM10011575_47040 [Microlunatus endophyticus]
MNHGIGIFEYAVEIIGLLHSASANADWFDAVNGTQPAGGVPTEEAMASGQQNARWTINHQIFLPTN